MPSASPLGPHPSSHRTPNRNTPMQPNVSNVVLGNLHIKPWYPSFYPEDLVGGKKVDRLYVCQWCFKYTQEIMKFGAHCNVCDLKNNPPPGDVVYEKNGYAIHQVDGEENSLYAQNLSLFAKLFLDTKSVFFDVGTFLYYLLVQQPSAADSTAPPGGQVVGFFSKEKMSWDNNNVACIITFPPWQRRGLGQILIAASYYLGKREGRFGGPERPLSTTGRKGYIKYWSAELAKHILNCGTRKVVTIKEISEQTWILPEDIVAALKEMDCYEKRTTASGNVVVSKSRVREWAQNNHVSDAPAIDVDAFVTDDEEEGSEDADSEAESG
ncbi:histone acetyltransferase, MYST family [Polychaeton citri CBS 116435]|uniref:histone acetyltransferase n=1 Tax=Polychaeton citri CBS 116435 TaxID=1314669 RepID=A0A9P4UQ43_9PEZI|nr:histone acetyltransferase, MYST family [Polychaeton citri CBS 116435]